MSPLRTAFAALLAATAVTAATAPSGVHAATVDGTLKWAGNVALVPLILDADADDVRIFTDSYARRSHFDPALAVWDAAGRLLAISDDYEAGFPLEGAMTLRDAGVQLDLAAGTYTVSVMNWTNRPSTDMLADGFHPRYRALVLGRKDYWRLNATAGSFGTPTYTMTSAVPEPGGLLMFVTGLGLAGLLGWRRRRNDARSWNA